MDRIKMIRVVGGKKYNTETATLVADDVYWDGHNFEHSGRNQWLYRTKKGNFFAVTGSFWQGEQDTLEPLSVEEAKEMFENGQMSHELSWKEAFREEPEEA